jgi:tetratricopeptide (TPR) repeat protein
MRRMFANIGRIVILTLLSPFLPHIDAQMNMAAHVMETQDEIPPEKLPPPVHMAGIGNAHLRITAAVEAQVWFDQGLNLLHDFWDYESARAFEQAVRVDPNCAMCFWGLYKAESFYHSTAQGLAGNAVRKAVQLEEHASAHERLYIDAAMAHEKAVHNPSPASLYAEEQRLLRKLVDDYPADTQAKLFLAHGGSNDSLALLQEVLTDHPDDSAANHYYIHRLEISDHPEQALHSAEILGQLAPASGHMVHMPGHIFFRVGDYARAEKSFADSLEVDERYMREQHIDPDNDWNYVHNLMYFVANLLEAGKFREATSVSDKISGARGKLESTLYIYSTRDSISRLDPRLPVALRTADFPLVLKLLKTSTVRSGMPNLEFLHRCLMDLAAGMIAVNRSKFALAERIADRLDDERKGMSEQKQTTSMTATGAHESGHRGSTQLAVMPDALLDPLLSTLSIMSLELRASLAAGHGNFDDAKKLFARGAQQAKALGYREPPIYIRPVGEAEGAALLQGRKWSDAKAAFEKALQERPHSGFALYGIATANERLGDSQAASKAYSDFLAAWQDADAGLPERKHARAYKRAHPV